jgi:hypothetical protein
MVSSPNASHLPFTTGIHFLLHLLSSSPAPLLTTLQGPLAAQVVPHVHHHIIPRAPDHHPRFKHSGNPKPARLPDMNSKYHASWTMFGRGYRTDLDRDDPETQQLVRRIRHEIAHEISRGELDSSYGKSHMKYKADDDLAGADNNNNKNPYSRLTSTTERDTLPNTKFPISALPKGSRNFRTANEYRGHRSVYPLPPLSTFSQRHQSKAKAQSSDYGTYPSNNPTNTPSIIDTRVAPAPEEEPGTHLKAKSGPLPHYLGGKPKQIQQAEKSSWPTLKSRVAKGGEPLGEEAGSSYFSVRELLGNGPNVSGPTRKTEEERTNGRFHRATTPDVPPQTTQMEQVREQASELDAAGVTETTTQTQAKEQRSPKAIRNEKGRL